MNENYLFLKKKITTILLRPFTAINLIIGILFLIFKNVSDSFKIAIIINIFLCSILGIVFLSYNLQKMSYFYHYPKYILMLIDIILHIIAPSIVIGLLYKNIRNFNVIHSLIFGFSTNVIYLYLFDYRNHYAYIYNMNSYLFFGILCLLFLNFLFFMKFS